ncbi:TetR/AcrR family transcriptional regulator [soil metagenome]
MTSTVKPPRKQPQRKAAERRAVESALIEGAETVERIVTAAARLMARDGELEPNMRELLSSAGISTRAFYRHFPSKAALISVVIEEIYNEMLDRLQQSVVASDTAEHKLRGWIDATLDYAADPDLATRGRALVVHQAQLSRDYADVYIEAGRALNAQIAAIIEQGIADNVFCTSKVQSDARMIVSLTVATMQRHVILVSSPSPGEAAQLADFVLRTLR